MFTIKIFAYRESGVVQHSISAPHYEIQQSGDENQSVIIYKDFSITNGVEYKISKSEADFDSCFIENSTGKTIDKVVIP